MIPTRIVRPRKPSKRAALKGRLLRIVCGPCLRHMSHESAVLWMELSTACTVAVTVYRGKCVEERFDAKTFQVDRRHYAIVALKRLHSRTWYEYDIAATLPGQPAASVWPVRGAAGPLPRSTFQTFPTGMSTNFQIAYFSCHTARTYDDDGDNRNNDGTGIDALKLFARRIVANYRFRRLRWPQLLVHLGDQIYVDSLSEALKNKINETHRAQGLPEGLVLSFDEHALLYNETWSDAETRWMMSCIPSLMILDDHEVIDDWNISSEWAQQQQKAEWWPAKLEASLLAYWVYQGAGNLSPKEWPTDERMKAMLPPLMAHSRDVTAPLTSLFRRYATGQRRAQWSFSTAVGPTRLIFVDCRTKRDLKARKMLDDQEWNWFRDAVKKSKERVLLIGMPLPFLLPEAIHELEASSEASGTFPWSLDPLSNALDKLIRVDDKSLKRYMREKFDLEHWSAFSHSFDQMLDLLEEINTPGQPRRFVGLLSGDVHFSYNMKGRLAKAPLRPFYQLVSSPARNIVSSGEATLLKTLASPVGTMAVEVGRALAAAHGSPGLLPVSTKSVEQKARLKWDPLHTGRGWMWTGNFIATLRIMPSYVQCVYERADRVREYQGEQEKVPKSPYPGRRLTEIGQFTATI